jgi:hypothetical protein
MRGMQTFLVRVWTPAAGEEDDGRRRFSGLVEHVASRRSETFQGELDLLEFINGCLQAHQGVRRAAGHEA